MYKEAEGAQSVPSLPLDELQCAVLDEEKIEILTAV